MRVQRSLYIPAPRGDAVHAFGQCYTTGASSHMVESVVHHAFDGQYYYTRQLYRRYSEDNGQSWAVQEPVFAANPGSGASVDRTPTRHFRDPNNGLLLAFHSDWRISSREEQFSSATTNGTYRILYELSRDEGRTWEAPCQVIHQGDEYDARHWLPGVTYGTNGAYIESCQPTMLEDGTLIMGIVIPLLREDSASYRPYGEYWYQVAFLRGRWLNDGSGLRWEMGERLRVLPEFSSIGCCEPDLLSLGGNRLVTTLRCQGNPRVPGCYSHRARALSEDGGLTWTVPGPLCYDDGTPVYVPASYSAFLRSPRTGKAYWFANILDHPVYGQYPRYPLVMAEFDTERLCLVRASRRVIQGLPEGAPPCTNELPVNNEECGRQYTNFGAYVDRETDEFVLIMPEMPKTTWQEFTSDCIRLRVSE